MLDQLFLIFDTEKFTVQTHFVTMADEQAAPVPAPENSLTATQSFYRILYNGNSTNMLNTKQVPIDFANIQDVFECVITMAQENIELPIAAIKKVRMSSVYTKKNTKKKWLTNPFFSAYRSTKREHIGTFSI